MAGRTGRLALYSHLAGAERRHHRLATVQAVAGAFGQQPVATWAHMRPAVEREEEVRPGIRGFRADKMYGIEQFIDLAADKLLLFDQEAGELIDRLLVFGHQPPAIDIGAAQDLGDIARLIALVQDRGHWVRLTLGWLEAGALRDQPVADHLGAEAVFVVPTVGAHAVKAHHEGRLSCGAGQVARDAARVFAVEDALDGDAAQAPADLAGKT